MKTAMQELKERLLVDASIFPDRASYVYEIIGDMDGELLETEKQQIIEAYSEGMGHYGDANNRSEADKYYNETFKK